MEAMKTLISIALILSVVPTATSRSCSKGTVGTVTCNDAATCEGDFIVGCETSCIEACSSTTFVESDVSCTVTDTWRSSCSRAYFNQSTVELSANAECPYCTFWFSAVTANQVDSLAAADDYNGPSFQLCSCCDDQGQTGGCPSDVPSCTDDNLGFCSDHHLFRTCKDWGNPVCEDVQVPTTEPKTSAANCSAGVDTVWCHEQDACAELMVDNCTVICGEDACENGNLQRSVVGCYNTGSSSWGGSCDGAVFNHSFVDIRDAECHDCTFWFSAVTTNSAFEDTYAIPKFWFCSCCDDSSGGNNCPDGVPSCTQDTVGFCSNVKYFRTCQDWGNPICENVEVPETVALEAAAKWNASNCSAGVETVWCTDRESCDSVEMSSCRVFCGRDSCETSVFDDSMVSCQVSDSYHDSCDSTTFRRSHVELVDVECGSCSFYFSAVTTNGPFGTYSFNEPNFGFCSCCDDVSGQDNCPSTVPSCADDPVSFCSTVHLGRTCQEWGNPVCQNIEIVEVEDLAEEASATNATNATTTNALALPTCSLSGNDDIFVCTGLDCTDGTVSNCTLECYGESCSNAVFEDSGVGCLGKETCAGSSFFRSSVDCKASDCKDTDYFSSALYCDDDGEASYDSNCEGVLLARCSCCSGDNCPEGALSCDQDTVTFCNSTFAGRTCADWKHPKCKGIELPSLPPPHPADTCNLGEDIYSCDDGIRGCLGLDSRNCTVLCTGPTCNQATFQDSRVSCSDRAEAGFISIYPGEACVSARFSRSVVSCQNSCVSASFATSYVNCGGQAGCPGTSVSFDECSCCDGPQCPFGVPECDGNIDSICTRVVDGATCACRGFPLCEDAHLASCPDGSSVQKKMSFSTNYWDLGSFP